MEEEKKWKQKQAKVWQYWRLCCGAEAVFARIGYRARVADVIKQSGQSRRTFYECFLSIEDLIDRMHFATTRYAEKHGGHAALIDVPSCEHIILASGVEDGREICCSAQDCVAHVLRIASGHRADKAPTFLAEDGNFGGPLHEWFVDVSFGRST